VSDQRVLYRKDTDFLLAEDWLKISYGIAEDIVRMIFFHTVLHN
jgi:hypothetical protein